MLKLFENVGKYLIYLICFVLKVVNGVIIFSMIFDYILNNILIFKI